MAGDDKGPLRARGGHEDSKVTFVELFFDLVFVLAVTQLSHASPHRQRPVWETLSLRAPPTPGMTSSAGTPAVS
jgi:Bacterial low temperature requirement A protein (LtrA)